MTLIDLSPRISPDSDAPINLRIEFDSAGKIIRNFTTIPVRISGIADDLAGCDAVSTCASDSESVVLFDCAFPQSTMVCGSSVIFRNLRPETQIDDVTRWLQSTGMIGELNFPSFNVVENDGSTVVFNFGFCSVLLAAPEEAVLLNFLLHSTGLDEVLCLRASEKRVVHGGGSHSPSGVASVSD